MMTTIMFIGMSFCIPIAYAEAYWQRRRQRKENDGAHAPLLNGTTEDVCSFSRPDFPSALPLQAQHVRLATSGASKRHNMSAELVHLLRAGKVH